ncbi:MAG: ABC transporter substrate-binding protein [Planctomycetota bacterium]|nr:ABC transporter substrate-binding protein [Planctomycetota bacterium]
MKPRKRTKLIWVLGVLILLVACLLFIHRSPKKSVQPLEKVRLGYNRLSGNLPILVAMDHGYFKEVGIDLESQVLEKTSDVVNAILAGDLEIGGIGGFSYTFIVESQSPGRIKLFFPAVEDDKNYASAVLVKKDSNVLTLDDLKGKVVGTYSGSAQDIYMRLFLEKVGLSDKVERKQVDTAFQLQALRQGIFDALFTTEPYCTEAVESGVARVLFPNARCEIMKPFPIASFVMSSEFLKSKPQVAANVYRAIEKGLTFCETNPVEARKSLTKYLDIDNNVAQKLGIYTFKRTKDVDVKLYQGLADLFWENKIIEKPVDVKHMFLLPQEIESERK